MRTFAIVPAAGRSARMGRPKLSLPVGGRAVIELVVSALRDGGVGHVLVVAGPHDPELAPLAAAAGAEVLRLPTATPDMRTTVEIGLAHMEDRFHPAPDDWWLLVPGDHPALSAAVVRDLLDCAEVTHCSVVVPVHDGQRGHPAAIRWRNVGALRASPPGLGVDSFLRSLVTETAEWPVVSRGVLADIDTPDDYRRMEEAAAG